MISGTRLCPRGDADASATTKESGRLVLVVEDEPDIQSMVAEHLTQAGYDVCLASDGELALRIIREQHPEVVCLDLNLPRISGYEVCEQIRSDAAIKDVSILITSARNAFDVRVFSLEAGADAYLVKPYGMKQLIDEIERLFALRAEDRANRAAAGHAEAQSACAG
jgi:DNA-binding response OmpR family regulator